ncbi:IS3 family transposase [Aliiglaciecola sp. 2_MG-2023]|uniref:IS3 family transposase n=1 Tax=unclassified Aliiglaciecola TaxID=2593648 RepID=UPI0026E32D78|nr:MULTISPECIES: IS3 family transposase [unclassified Aliiglaciecola]MDO6710253.1 IS3 family transposase [Aliiglaciecola sp. 2_MG-2023]MDO6751401.1 IS3 family transposase [Aliiglaciecola sp. 1_MG-2023]
MKKAGFNVQHICRCLNVPRSSFYFHAKPKRIKAGDIHLEAAVKHIHNEMDATYGSRRMMIELNHQGYKVGRYKVRRLMRKFKLIAKRPRLHRYPYAGKASIIAPNYLNRQFNPEQLNTHWSGDITYIRTGQGWLYLAVIVDLCSRKIISWAFSDKPNTELTTRAIRLAVNKREPMTGVIFHSVQGAQYTSDSFQKCLSEFGIQASMSRAGNCLDNAVTERFFRSLKSERVNYRRYQTRHQAQADIIDYIEPFYNQKRRHHKLENISPVEYEMKLMKSA